MTVRAGFSMLRFLKRNRERIYEKLGRTGEEERKGIDKVFADNELHSRSMKEKSRIQETFIELTERYSECFVWR